MVFLFLVFWLGCGLLATGILNGDIQGEWDEYEKRAHNPDMEFLQQHRREAVGFSYFMGLLGGPFMMLIAFFLSGFISRGCNWTWKSRVKKNDCLASRVVD